MTSLTDTQVITASGGTVELGYSERTSDLTVTGSAGSGNTGPADLTIVSDGSPVMIEFFVGETEVNAYQEVHASLYLDGVETHREWFTTAGQDGGGFTLPNQDGFVARYRHTFSAGSHTVGVRFWGQGVLKATGTTNAPMFLRVSKIVQATQWPAVTTGSIICTSSTRPASPFEGQAIYETDTDKQLVWNASAWKQMAGSSATFSDDLTVSGMLYQPNRPMFSARATAGAAATATWNTYVDVFANVGSHFNTTTGLFTAPVAAKYFFTFSAFTEAGQQAQCYFYLNGVAYNRTYTANGTATYVALNPGIVIFNLAAGDTVGVWMNVGQTHFNQNNYFSGWMLG